MTKRMKHPEMRNTAFGRVVAELLEAREMPITPFTAGKLAEDAGLDGWEFIDRMADASHGHIGYLDEFAAELELTLPEMKRLAHAYTFEERLSPLPTA